MGKINYYAVFDFLEKINDEKVDLEEFQKILAEYAKSKSDLSSEQEHSISRLKTASNNLVGLINDCFMNRTELLQITESDDEDYLYIPKIIEKGVKIKEKYGDKKSFNKSETCDILTISRPTLNSYLKNGKYGLQTTDKKIELKTILKAYGYIMGLI